MGARERGVLGPEAPGMRQAPTAGAANPWERHKHPALTAYLIDVGNRRPDAPNVLVTEREPVPDIRIVHAAVDEEGCVAALALRRSYVDRYVALARLRSEGVPVVLRRQLDDTNCVICPLLQKDGQMRWKQAGRLRGLQHYDPITNLASNLSHETIFLGWPSVYI